MPITKVPVVHKFGIISHSQRVELQERLLKQSYLKTLGTKEQQCSAIRNPLEISEEFTTHFNNARTAEEKEKLEEQAFKMLERVKRRAGLRAGGVGHHVDLPVAWTELAQLAQCRGKVQEACFDVLISSLEHAPLEIGNIVALFFLAETSLYWLRTDVVNQPYLRTAEIKLLKMGQLVFCRLFYHHMSGHLQGYNQFKNRLFQYLDGLSDCQDAYNPYPNALLSLRFVNEVGKIVIADASLDPGELKEGDNIPTDQLTVTSNKAMSEAKKQNPAKSAAVSSSVHDLSPTLWHSLDVWRCTNGLGGGLGDALKALAHCAAGIATESWIDACCAMLVLTEASKANMQVLKILQNLARGVMPDERKRILVSPDINLAFDDTDYGTIEDSRVTNMGESRTSLSDIYEKNEEELTAAGLYSKTKSQGLDDLSKLTFDLENNENVAEDQKDLLGIDRNLKSGAKDTGQSQRRAKLESRRKVTRESQISHYGSDVDTVATGWRGEAGSDLPYGRASQASYITYSNAQPSDTCGIHGWRWEVAFYYTNALADVCLRGTTSSIQKRALLGENKEADMLHKYISRKVPMRSAGLLDLVYFYAVSEETDGGPNDWSWRVRYAAIHSLVKICQCLAGDKNRDGLRTVAWNVLLKAHSLEKDERVLEAYKVGQVDANIQNLLAQHTPVPTSTLGAKVATGLVKAYLPPLPPPVASPIRKSPSPAKVTINHPVPKQPLRTSLREEIMLATSLQEPTPDFQTRTSFDLKRIVEDQWRKDLEKQLSKEEDERQKELQEIQKQEEEKQRQIEENRMKKLGLRYRPNPMYSTTTHSTGETASSSKTHVT